MNQRTHVIHQWMKQVIEANNFQVARIYPGDLALDIETISALDQANVQLAWCVGDTHTHMAVLGIHPDDNAMVESFARLNSSDKLFKISLYGTEDFRVTCLNTEQFSKLSGTPIPYSKSMRAGNSCFDLLKHDRPIARIDIELEGDFENRRYKATIRPTVKLNCADTYAARSWAQREMQHIAQSLFFVSTIIVLDGPETDSSNQNANSFIDFASSL